MQFLCTKEKLIVAAAFITLNAFCTWLVIALGAVL